MTDASWWFNPDISEIDPSSKTHLLPLNSMYITNSVLKDQSHEGDVHHIFTCLQEFMLNMLCRFNKDFLYVILF